MEDAHGIIMPPKIPGDDTLGLRRVLELFILATGLEWSELVIGSRHAADEIVIAVGVRSGTAASLELESCEARRLTLRYPAGAKLPDTPVEIFADAVERELERSRLLRESALLQNAANAADAAVLIFGSTGNILFANALADKLIAGQTESELTAAVNGGPPQPLFRLLCSRVGALHEGSGRDGWLDRIEVSDGSELSCLITLLPAVDADSGRAVLVVLRGLAPPPDQRVNEFAEQHKLSPRETEVLRHLVEGLDTVHLAERLGISPHTVRDHLKNIFHKTASKSRSELLSALSGASGAHR